MPTDFSKPSPPPYVPPKVGQDTGGDARRHQEEGIKILKLLISVDPKEQYTEGNLSQWEVEFLYDMHERVAARGLSSNFSGREVFRLREIKDKLVEKGVI